MTDNDLLGSLEAKLDREQLIDFNDNLPKRANVLAWIESLEISADAKALLMSVANAAATVGDIVVSVGLKVIETIKWALERYPSTAFGIVVGGVLSWLVAGIPLIGFLIGPLLTPLFMAFGIGAGAISDMRAQVHRDHIDRLERQFAIFQVNA